MVDGLTSIHTYIKIANFTLEISVIRTLTNNFVWEWAFVRPVKLLLEMPTSRARTPRFMIQLCSKSSFLLVRTLGSNRGWVPGTQGRDPDSIPSSWLHPCPTWVTASIWGVSTQQMGALSFCLYVTVCLPKNKQYIFDMLIFPNVWSLLWLSNFKKKSFLVVFFILSLVYKSESLEWETESLNSICQGPQISKFIVKDGWQSNHHCNNSTIDWQWLFLQGQAQLKYALLHHLDTGFIGNQIAA